MAATPVGRTCFNLQHNTAVLQCVKAWFYRGLWERNTPCCIFKDRRLFEAGPMKTFGQAKTSLRPFVSSSSGPNSIFAVKWPRLRWLWLSGSPPLIFVLCVLLFVESVYGRYNSSSITCIEATCNLGLYGWWFITYIYYHYVPFSCLLYSRCLKK